jgi:acyl carrier protein
MSSTAFAPNFNLRIMIEREMVLAAMKEFITAQFPTLPADRIESLSAGDVIRQSLELVEFVLHLEERLGIEVNISQLGENLIVQNFGALADELVRLSKGDGLDPGPSAARSGDAPGG